LRILGWGGGGGGGARPARPPLNPDTIRYGLQRHLLETRKEDFVDDKSYDETNTIFKTMLVHLKKGQRNCFPQGSYQQRGHAETLFT
jgi:hypothetical protein